MREFTEYLTDGHKVNINYWPEEKENWHKLSFKIEGTYLADPKKFMTGRIELDPELQTFTFYIGKGEVNPIGFGGIISSRHYPSLDIPLEIIYACNDIAEVIDLIKGAMKRYIFAKGYRDGSIFE